MECFLTVCKLVPRVMPVANPKVSSSKRTKKRANAVPAPTTILATMA